jgi:tripartite-type tricarboxylate transporter receptor subunit TctC
MIPLSRRLFLAGLSVSALSAPSFAADDYPNRPIRLVVPYAPGGSTDTIARIVGQQVAKTIGQPVVIENKPGAASAVGALFVARAPADGYTLLLGTGALAINKAMRKDLGYELETDLAPVANGAGGYFVVATHPEFPAKTLAELIAYAKANPGKLNFGSPGAGTQNHLAGELFSASAGIKMVHVPFRGEGLAVTATVAKDIEVVVASYSGAGAFVENGQLRALAVTSATRANVLPSVPAVGEVIAGFDAGFWNGFLAPANTPKPIVDRLNKEIIAALRTEDVRDRFRKLGLDAIEQTPDEMRALITADVAKWTKLVETAGLKATD